MIAKPKLRPEIEAVPWDRDGAEVYLCYDRSGISAAQLELAPMAAAIAARLDGEHSLLDVQDECARELGDRPAIAAVEEVLLALDQADFLDTPRFQDYLAQLQREFAAQPVREATSAGSAYSADPAALATALQGYIDAAPPPEDEDRATNARRAAPRGVIVPHMDFSRAGLVYGQVYRELAQCARPEAVVVIGTAHYPLPRRYAVCPKDFALPGGVLRYARELTAELLRRTAPVADFAADIIAHRNEHSVELQLVWLRHVWGPDVAFIPVLAGPIDDCLDAPEKAAADPQLNAFAQALRDLGREHRMTILASADLAHIGRRFGDDADLDLEFQAEAENADRNYLRAVKAGDGAGALAALAACGDAYRLCGTGCIYALNAALPGVPGRLLGYHQAISPELEQAVSCAGLIFE
ncbi:MAG: AmmeMemoRadiSam system protein B [Planctomycetes bacterium]|nr:AmmeMemoRadiSam system protein B [Planctomycetota bacterium]